MKKTNSLLNEFSSIPQICLATGISLSLLSLNIKPVNGQIISDNTTGTIVNLNNNQFEITGGIENNHNLFHSFSELGLNANQIANFLANPNINNILGRVTGGNASYIDGIIQVSGSNSNLYLMNPAGIIFGNNTSLNVPADFTATTATGIAFSNEWFNAFGDNNYSDLVGNPTGFAFNTNNVGAIINTGDLEVNSGNNLSLIGANVVTTGNLTANEGNINVVSVPGSSKLILSQPGQIISLEIDILSENLGNSININPLDLPELLTGSNGKVETDLVVNEDNIVATILGTTIPTQRETTIIRGAIDTSSNINEGGNIYILGNTIGVLDKAQINASGMTGGGNIYIGGEYLGGGTLPTAETTVIDSDIIINADALLNGDGGEVIIWSDDYTNFLGTITARGGSESGNGGFVETSSKNILNVFGGKVDASAVNGIAGEWLLDPFNVTITSDPNSDLGDPFNPDLDNFNIDASTLTTALEGGTSVTVNTSGGGTQEGNITIESAILPTLNISDVTFTLNADNDIIVNAPITNDSSSTNQLNIDFTAGNDITFNADIVTLGGNIDLTATAGSIVTGSLNTAFTNSAPSVSSSFTTGNITLNAEGSITTGELNTYLDIDVDPIGSFSFTAGNITLNAEGSITTGELDASVESELYLNSLPLPLMTFTGGTVSLNSGSTINTGEIDTSAYSSPLVTNGGFTSVNATGGNVILTSGTTSASSNIVFESIDTVAFANTSYSTFTSSSVTGGNVTITASGGTVQGTGFAPYTTNTIKTEGAVGNINGITLANGTIDITHDGGADNAPFIVGDASINGTAGTIRINTSSEINPTESFPVLANGGVASGTPSGITITSINNSPVISATTTTINDSNLNFTLNSLNLDTTDSNNDNISFNIEVISGTLTVNGSTLNPGETTTVLPTDNIQYNPNEGEINEIIAFQIIASDVVSNSNTIAITYRPSEIPEDIENNIQRIDDYPHIPPTPTLAFQLPTLDRVKEILVEIEEETGVKPAIIYVSFLPSLTSNPNISQLKQENTNSNLNFPLNNNNVEIENINNRFTSVESSNSNDYNNYLNLPQELDDTSISIQPQNTDELELILITPGEIPIRKRIPRITRSDVMGISRQFQEAIISNNRRRNFLTPAQHLHQLLITPLEEDLQLQEIENIVFIMDEGLRSLPVAAFHDGEQYLVEKYSVGLMPSISLTDTRYVDVRNLEVLAMGAQTFDNQEALPFVPLELSTIQEIWNGESFLDEDFTKENLIQARLNNPYGIIHLATHSEFLPGKIDNSYIQFSDNKIRLNQIRQLGLNNPPVELMVLSACHTALGDLDAELGFAGLATQAGVKTALGSLWYVSDEGTFALMTNFYQELKEAPIKAEALRQAQIAMINGEILIPEISNNNISNDFSRINVSHPYYWSGFTMVGNPW